MRHIFGFSRYAQRHFYNTQEGGPDQGLTSLVQMRHFCAIVQNLAALLVDADKRRTREKGRFEETIAPKREGDGR